MLKTTLTIMAVILFFGCTSKKEEQLMKSYSDNKSYYKKLQKTEKTQLFDASHNVKATLTAMYLYQPTHAKRDHKDERFIVGLNLAEGDTNAISNVLGLESIHRENYAYKLTLNGQKAKNIQKLSLWDDRLKNLAFISEWNTYYLVTFAHTDKKRFKLIYKSPFYGKGELYFAKVSKFTFDQQPIF